MAEQADVPVDAAEREVVLADLEAGRQRLQDWLTAGRPDLRGA
jgi:hypothetical protein